MHLRAVVQAVRGRFVICASVCPRCEHSGYWRHRSRALYQCRACRHQVSLTAGTILASTKLPLRTWFLAMYLMTQTKNGISALEMSR